MNSKFRRTDESQRRYLWFVAAALSLVALVAFQAPPAAAQDDPYGATTTTAPIEFFPTCHYTLQASAPGANAVLTVTNVPFGGTVRVLVGGVEAGRATAPLAAQSASAGVVFGGAALPAQAGVTDLAITFTVPDLPPGVYQVTAVGADFTLTCDQETIEVLGGGGDGGSDAGSDDTGSGGTGNLPRTGIFVGLLLAVALVLLLVGRALTEASRRKREEAERQARREARRVAREAEHVASLQE